MIIKELHKSCYHMISFNAIPMKHIINEDIVSLISDLISGIFPTVGP